ncbi:Protein of unknown function [Lactobacillus delbrueckii subsp. bulgaricus]|nr:Protein of unknown function [Lactobacillus delbrueckii subsp. bulgaricus]
MSYLSLKRAT